MRLEGRLAAKDYINVLETCLVPFLESLENHNLYTFQDDNAPIHTAKKTAKWKLDSNIPCLPWTPQSPDLNPIEHLWNEFVTSVQ
jgi:transposase